MSNPFPKICILLLNYNGKKDTLECLQSLQKVTYPHYQIVIVDNGSIDDSVGAFQTHFPNIFVIETHENLGFAGGNNVGIEWALAQAADWILLLNNDTIVDPNFLHAFLEGAQKQSKAKILGAKILRYDQPKIIDHLGGYWDPKKGEFCSPDAGKPDHLLFSMQKVDYVCGAALLMHHTVPRTIGLLEPKFFLFWEESDYCYRAKKVGFDTWTVPEARIWHKVSASFTGGKPHTHYFWWRSRLLWIARNCSTEEKYMLYRKVLLPAIWKMARHFVLKSLFGLNREKKRLYQAGCMGVIDYFRGRFGNAPSWILKKQSSK